MFIFLSFLLVIMALYYLGVMADAYNADTTYLTPLIALLVYAIICIIREGKRGSMSWLLGEDVYDMYGENHYTPKPPYNTSYQNNSSYNSSYNSGWSNQYDFRPSTDKVECFVPDNKKKDDDAKELIHYPSRSEVREKIKELEKSSLWRFKRNTASIFGVDITEKYYKPRKIKDNVTVKPLPKEDDTKYMPKMSWQAEKEIKEYNEVAGHVGRSFEIAITDTIILDDADN